MNIDLDGGFPRQFDGNDEKALQFLLSKLDSIKSPNIAEIGVWAGRTTSIIGDYLKNRKSGHVYSVDHFKGSDGTALIPVGQTLDIQSIFINNITTLGLLEYVVMRPYPSEKAVEDFNDEYFDLIFIDADHRYSGISKDIAIWFPKLKPGGIICGHDCESKEFDEKYIHQDCVNLKHHGVIKAVFERFPNANINSTVWWTIKEKGI